MNPMSNSLKLAWISRFLIKVQSSKSWKVIPEHFFLISGGLQFLLRCNSDQEFLEEAHFPNFFAEFKSSYNPQESAQELVIFSNKQICINC